jgi:hypothetical protein
MALSTPPNDDKHAPGSIVLARARGSEPIVGSSASFVKFAKTVAADWPGAQVAAISVSSRSELFDWLNVLPAPLRYVDVLAFGDAYHVEFDASRAARRRGIFRARSLLKASSVDSARAAVAAEERWLAGFFASAGRRDETERLVSRLAPGAIWRLSLAAPPVQPAGSLTGSDPEMISYRSQLLSVTPNVGPIAADIAATLGLPCVTRLGTWLPGGQFSSLDQS